MNHQKWEYLELTEEQDSDYISVSNITRVKKSPLPKTTEEAEYEKSPDVYEAIRQIGLGGWEMCGCDCADKIWRFIFKRPLQQQDDHGEPPSQTDGYCCRYSPGSCVV